MSKREKPGRSLPGLMRYLVVKSRPTYIQVTADRLVLAAHDSSGALQYRSAPITLSQEPGQWAKELLRLSETLKDLVEAMAVSGRPAQVLYNGPTQAAVMESLNVRSTAHAVEAATLNCLEKVSYSRAMAVCEAWPVGRDGGGETRRTHVAVAADRDDVLGAIARFVESAGLQFESAIAIDAPLMVGLARQALQDQSATARLYIGEHSSLFMISGNHSLLFARRIGLGIESLVHALTRPIRVRSGDEPVTLKDEQAREMLRAHGMPERHAIVLEYPELRGMHIIPVLQPVLQRIVVELRQSLRFSLPEGSAASVPIQCFGPGSRIPGLPRVLAAELGTTLAERDGSSSDTEAVEQDIATLTDAITDHRLLCEFALRPSAHQRERQRMTLQRWLWAGTAAAVIMVAIDAFRHHAAVESLSSQKATMLSHHSQLEAFQRTSATLAGALSAMSSVERRVDAELQHHFDGYAVLVELSNLTPDSIQLTSITFNQSEAGVTGAIQGLALRTAEQQSALKEYVEQIRSSPLFTDVVLGNVQIGSEDGQTGERFEISLMVATLPRPEQVAWEKEDGRQNVAPAGDEP